jgi:hypothetical protein
MATSYSHQYQFRLEMRGHLITFYGKAMNFIFVTITQLSLMTSHRDDQKKKKSFSFWLQWKVAGVLVNIHV